MPSRRVDLHSAGAWVGTLQGRLRSAAVRGLQSAGERYVQEIVRLIEEEDPKPVDRGIYRAGWRSTKERDGAFVHNDVPWAPMVERGVRAENVKVSRAMIDAIAEWVIRKGIVSRGRGKAGKEAAIAEARSVAWAIARKMQERGIFNRDGREGLRILERAHKNLARIVHEEVKREVEKERGK